MHITSHHGDLVSSLTILLVLNIRSPKIHQPIETWTKPPKITLKKVAQTSSQIKTLRAAVTTLSTTRSESSWLHSYRAKCQSRKLQFCPALNMRTPRLSTAPSASKTGRLKSEKNQNTCPWSFRPQNFAQASARPQNFAQSSARVSLFRLNCNLLVKVATLLLDLGERLIINSIFCCFSRKILRIGRTAVHGKYIAWRALDWAKFCGDWSS